MKNMLKEAAILFAITLIAGCLLGLVYQVTKDPIAQAQEKAKEEASKEVFADANSFRLREDITSEDADKVVADADAINSWIDYCTTRSIVNGKSLHALLTDITIANSSVMGRIIDAAKTGEKVYAPFIDLFKNVKCAYGKNHVGITDIKIDW